MYIHLYTTSTSTSSNNEFCVWWYSQPTMSSEIFEDYHKILSKLYEYKEIEDFTGDILEITDINIFTEQIILLGINVPSETFDINLKDGNILQMNYGILIKKENEMHNAKAQFNELYDICFGEYPVCNSFSYSLPLSSTQQFINNKTNNEDMKGDIIRVQHMKGNYIYIDNINLEKLAYSVLKTNVSYNILYKWFKHTSKNISYFYSNKILDKIYNLNETLNKNEENIIIEKESCTNDITDIAWINDFCKLYAQEDSKCDTLLSDAYNQYIIASSWTDTPIVNMQAFIKQIKQISNFTIKRKSKGMVITGYKFLINKQEELFNKVKNGELCERNIVHFMSEDIITNILKNISKEISDTDILYHTESCILLHNFSDLNNTAIKQFYSNPYIKKSLPMIRKYFKGLKEKDTLESQINFFRECFQDSIIFFPFSEKLLRNEKATIKNNNSIFFNNSNKYIIDNIQPFDPFNCKIDSVYSNINDFKCDGETDIKNVLAGFTK